MKKKVFFIFLQGLIVWSLFARGSEMSIAGKVNVPDSLEISCEIADTVKIPEVEIIAAKRISETGLKITRPDSLAFHSALTTDLSEILSHYTPVFIKSYGRGSQATAHFRGTSASHTQITWNSLNLNSPMRGYADLSLVPLFFIDDLTLLHGGSSLTESSGALGGSIQLFNKPDLQYGKALLTILERGSFSTGRYMAKVQLGKGGFQSVTRIYNEFSENDFPFYNAGVIPKKKDTLANADYQRKALLQEFYYRAPSGLFLSLRGWLQANKRNLPPLMSYEGSPRKEFQNDDQFRLQFGLNKYSGKLDYRFSSGYSRSVLSYFLSVLPDEFIISDAVSVEKSFDNQFKINYSVSKALSFSGSAEANYHRVEAREENKMTVYNKERLEGGISVHVLIKPSERTGLYALSRSEFYDDKWIPVIPSVGGEWQPIRKIPLLMKMNVTRNYHKPGLNDLYWIPGGNPELLPEEGYTAEVCLVSDWKSRKIKVSQELSAYGSEIKNWIIWQPAASGAWYWEAANLDQVLSRGMEYSLNGSVSYGKGQIMFSGNYAFTRTYQPDVPESADESRKNQLIYIPKHSANIHVVFSRSGWSVSTDMACTGRRYTQSSAQAGYYERILSPYWLTSLSISKQMPLGDFDWGIRARVENVFNTRYQQILWRPMPERNYLLTLYVAYKK